MIRLEWLFFMQCVMGLLIVIVLRKQMQMKKQIDEITKEVINYISYVTEDMEEETLINTQRERSSAIEQQRGKSKSEKEKEEAQNSLIQAVLREYFP